MKKVFALFSIVIMGILLASCTSTSKVNLNLRYNVETGECTLINNNNENFKDLEVTLLLQNSNGYEKEIKEKIGKLNKGESYAFNLEDAEFDNILIMEYTEPMSAITIVFLIIFIIWVFSNFVYIIYLIRY